VGAWPAFQKLVFIDHLISEKKPDMAQQIVVVDTTAAPVGEAVHGVMQSPAAKATTGLNDRGAGSDHETCSGPERWGEHEKKRRFTTGHEGEVRRRLCREGGGRRWLPGTRDQARAGPIDQKL